MKALIAMSGQPPTHKRINENDKQDDGISVVLFVVLAFRTIQPPLEAVE